MSEINVTPFVDVMLVLLIIFMVAAPLMTVGVPVDLPRTAASPLNQETEPLTITVDPQGRIFLQETEVPMEDLVPRLQALCRRAGLRGVAGQQVGRGGSLGTSGGQGDQQDTGCGQPAAVVEQVWVGVLVHGDSLATMFDTQSDGWLKPPGRAQCSLPSRLQLPEPAHP